MAQQYKFIGSERIQPNKKQMKLKLLLYQIILLLLTSTASWGEPGVFAILKESKIPGKDPQVKGAAFLVDKDHGILITAAHVISDCELGKSKKVPIRWSMIQFKGNEHQKYEKIVYTKIIASGYNLTGKEEASAEQDWAVLQIHREKVYLFESFDIIEIDPGLTAKDLSEKSELNTHIYGFPRASETEHKKKVTINPEPGKQKTWLVEGKVEGGNSGGPCLFSSGEERPYYLLLGIVLEEAKSNPNYHQILPSYVFIREVVKESPPTNKVKRIIDDIYKHKNTANREHKNDLNERILVALKGLTGFEQLQIVNFLCRLEKGDEGDVVVFVCDYLYHYAKNTWFVESLFDCNRTLITDFLEKATEDINRTRSQSISFKKQELDKLRVSLQVVEYINKNLDQVKDLADKSTLSKALTDYVYLNVWFNEDKDFSLYNNYQALRKAKELDKSNPDLPAATAIAMKNISTKFKLALTGDKVLASDIESSKGANVAIQPGSDSLIYRQVWEPAGVVTSDNRGKFLILATDVWQNSQLDSLERSRLATDVLDSPGLYMK